MFEVIMLVVFTTAVIAGIYHAINVGFEDDDWDDDEDDWFEDQAL